MRTASNHVLVLPALEPVFTNLWTGIRLFIEQNVSTAVTLNMLTWVECFEEDNAATHIQISFRFKAQYESLWLKFITAGVAKKT